MQQEIKLLCPGPIPAQVLGQLHIISCFSSLLLINTYYYGNNGVIITHDC